ncbi:glycosyltransferase [Pseudolactococcus laudensis]|uniref:glycosyltransferase n=1 Tax=Pseudolactococcus laudensis TaxID=1494461 RepID=UPI002FCA4F3B
MRAVINNFWTSHFGTYIQRNSLIFISKFINWKKFNDYKNPKNKRELNKSNRSNHIVVSLTTIPSRITSVKYVIDIMFQQTLRPDNIILYVEKELNKSSKLKELDKLVEKGLIIKFVDDIGPHKKYYYAMKEFPKSLIVTIDDDVWYSKKLIERLYNSYLKYPNSISAMRVNRIKGDKNNILLPYHRWEFDSHYSALPEKDLIATGVGGVLYPPDSLHNDWKDLERIKKSCFYTDDLWLKAMETKADTPVVCCSRFSLGLLNIPNSQEEALNVRNINQFQNDINISKISAMYPDCNLFPIRKN